MHLIKCLNNFTFDKGLNLLQKDNSGTPKIQRIIPTQTSNRSISDTLYQSLGLTAAEKANLNQTLIDKGIFDLHGNQLRAQSSPNMAPMVLSWDYRNMMQSTATALPDETTIKEYNVYAKPGLRNRKVTEKIDAKGSTTEISETTYLGNLEYHTDWQGENLNYDGNTVTEQSTGDTVAPYEQFTSLRIRHGHKQVAQKKKEQYKYGTQVTVKTTTYSLDNNIDSCELTLNGSGLLESYESYQPYGDTAISYGTTNQQSYKYSGQEKDQNGLYYYGFRSYLPTNFRWVSPDPAGTLGSGLNWYAMVEGNPVTIRDEFGLGPFEKWAKRLMVPSLIGVGSLSFGYYNKDKLSEKWNGNQFISESTFSNKLGERSDKKQSFLVHDMNAWNFKLERTLLEMRYGKAYAFDKLGFDMINLFGKNEKMPENLINLESEIKPRLKKHLIESGMMEKKGEEIVIFDKVMRSTHDSSSRSPAYLAHMDAPRQNLNDQLIFKPVPEAKEVVAAYNLWILQDEKIQSPNLGFIRKDSFSSEDFPHKESNTVFYNSNQKWYTNMKMEKGDAYLFDNSNTAHSAVPEKTKVQRRNSVEFRIFQYRLKSNEEHGNKKGRLGIFS